MVILQGGGGGVQKWIKRMLARKSWSSWCTTSCYHTNISNKTAMKYDSFIPVGHGLLNSCDLISVIGVKIYAEQLYMHCGRLLNQHDGCWWLGVNLTLRHLQQTCWLVPLWTVFPISRKLLSLRVWTSHLRKPVYCSKLIGWKHVKSFILTSRISKSMRHGRAVYQPCSILAN